MNIELLLRKFQANTATAQEIELLKEYFDVNNFDDLHKVLAREWTQNSQSQDLPQELKQSMWQEIDSQTDSPLVTLDRKRIMVVAASVVVLIAVGLTLFLNGEPNAKEISDSITTTTNQGTVPIHITLDDGSSVTLKKGSTIDVEMQPEDSIRKVILVGEAFFNVVENKQKPFKVFAQDLEITVLGTQFNVAAYNGEQTAQVDLVEGSVEVTELIDDEQTTIVLSDGETVAYRKETYEFEKPEQLKEEDLAWRQGVVSFKNANLAEVVKELEYWFDIRINQKTDFSSESQLVHSIDLKTADLDKELQNISKVTDYTFIKTNSKIYSVEKD